MVGFPMEVARSHDEVDFGGAADIGDGVAGHGHDVGDPARFENADVLAAEEFGGGSGGGAQGPGGVDAGRDHGLKFEVAVRERERPTVGSVGDLDAASGDQTVGMLDLLGIAGGVSGG